MENRTTMAFRVRDKGGSSGGKTLCYDFPSFDLDKLSKAPNFKEFVMKCYLAEVKKLIREISENKNGTRPQDLDSLESIIARSLCFTSQEIKDWIQTRDWTRASQVKDLNKLRPIIEKTLPTLANRRHPYDEEAALALADKLVAAVADNPDPVADFLFTVLTTKTREESHLLNAL